MLPAERAAVPEAAGERIGDDDQVIEEQAADDREREDDGLPHDERGERVERQARSEEHTSELQSPDHLVCRLLLEKKNKRSTAPSCATFPTPEPGQTSRPQAPS